MRKIVPGIGLGFAVLSIRSALVYFARSQHTSRGPYAAGQVLGMVFLGLLVVLGIRKLMRG